MAGVQTCRNTFQTAIMCNIKHLDGLKTNLGSPKHVFWAKKSPKIEQNQGKWLFGTTYQDERGQNDINIACIGLKQIETSTNIFL